jgi:predicted transcriptional regulator
MALPIKEKRSKALTVKISDTTYKALLRLADKYNLSQADVIEALIDQEAREMKRLKGKQSRYNRR